MLVIRKNLCPVVKKEGFPSQFTSSAGSDCAVFCPVRGLQAP